MYGHICQFCGAHLDPQEHCNCIGQKVADGRVVIGVDLARGKDCSVVYNPETGKRKII